MALERELIGLAGQQERNTQQFLGGLGAKIGQGAGDAINSTVQAQFNQQLARKEDYLNEIADELNLDEETRKVIPMFGGSLENVKAGAQFLLQAGEEKKKRDSFTDVSAQLAEDQLGFGTRSEDLFSAEAAKLGLTTDQLSKEQKEAISSQFKDSESERRKQFEFGLGDRQSVEQSRFLTGGGLEGLSAKDLLRKQIADRKAGQTDTRLEQGAEKIDITKGSEKRKGKQFNLQLHKTVIKALDIEDPKDTQALLTGINSTTDTLEEEILLFDDLVARGVAAKGDSLPGFNPFKSLDALPQSVRAALSEAGVSSKEYKERSNAVRSSILRYLNSYKKFISGTAVSDQEFQVLKDSLSAGKFNTFAEFMNAFVDMAKKDSESAGFSSDQAGAIEGGEALERYRSDGGFIPSDHYPQLISRLEKLQAIADQMGQSKGGVVGTTSETTSAAEEDVFVKGDLSLSIGQSATLKNGKTVTYLGNGKFESN